MSKYYDYALRSFAASVSDAQMEDALFYVIMDLEGALGIPAEGTYHSQAHCMHVSSLAYNLGKLSGFDDQVCRNLLVAGLFHDAGHAGTAYIEDKHNVGVAINTFDKWDIEGIQKETVIRMITCTTEDDRKIKRVKSAPIPEQLLVDADLLTITAKEHEAEILEGLEAEGYRALDANSFFSSRGVFTLEAKHYLMMHGIKTGLYC